MLYVLKARWGESVDCRILALSFICISQVIKSLAKLLDVFLQVFKFISVLTLLKPIIGWEHKHFGELSAVCCNDFTLLHLAWPLLRISEIEKGWAAAKNYFKHSFVKPHEYTYDPSCDRKLGIQLDQLGSICCYLQNFRFNLLPSFFEFRSLFHFLRVIHILTHGHIWGWVATVFI